MVRIPSANDKSIGRNKNRRNLSSREYWVGILHRIMKRVKKWILKYISEVYKGSKN